MEKDSGLDPLNLESREPSNNEIDSEEYIENALKEFKETWEQLKDLEVIIIKGNNKVKLLNNAKGKIRKALKSIKERKVIYLNDRLADWKKIIKTKLKNGGEIDIAGFSKFQLEKILENVNLQIKNMKDKLIKVEKPFRRIKEKLEEITKILEDD